MADMHGRRVVVTGAASGLGRAFATAFGEQGASLALCDLDLERLDAVAMDLRTRGCTVQTWRVDVADPDDMARFAREVGEGGPVHMVVNNAGVAVGGLMADTPPAAWRKVVDVNLLGVVHGCHAFLPLLEQADGRRAFINVASASAFAGVPGLGAYAATKAAVLSLSQTLLAELDGHGIQVHCVCPGFVRTGLLGQTDMFLPDAEQARDFLWEKVFRPERTTDQVAKATLKAVHSNRFLVPVFSEGHVGNLLRRMPEGVGALLRRQMMGRIAALTNAS